MTEDMKQFQGTWKQISCEKDGVKDPIDEQGWDPHVTYSGDTFVVSLADGSTPIKGTFKIDPTQEPKAMDMTDTFGVDAGETFLAIYTLEGDRLTFCAADAGMERPKDFTTRPGLVLRISVREAS